MAALVVAVVALPSCMEKEQAIDDEIDNIKPSEGHFIVKASAPGSYTAESGTKSTFDASLIFSGNTPLPEIYPDLETKASLSPDDHKTVLWDNGDRICVFGDDGNSKSYAQNLNESGSRAAFELADGSYSYAYYPSPASSGASVSGSTITIPGGFPEVQTLTEGSFARDVNLMVAKAQPKGTQWQFHNAGALLKVTIDVQNPDGDEGMEIKDLVNLDGEQVPAITLTELNGAMLSGNAVVKMKDDGSVEETTVQDGSSSVGLSTGGTDKTYTLKKGENHFYFLVPPGNYGGNKGISLDVCLASGEVYCFMNYNAITVSRNANIVFANNLPVDKYEAYNKDTDPKFYETIVGAAEAAGNGHTVKLLREKFYDNSERNVTFSTPCTFDLNGYGYRGELKLDLKTSTETMTIKDGCVWQVVGDDKGQIYVTSGKGKVVLDNAKAKSVWTGGLDFDLSRAVIFDGTHAFMPEKGTGDINIYAGSMIHHIGELSGNTKVTIHGNYLNESKFADNGPFFQEDNNPLSRNESHFCVKLDEGTFISDGPEDIGNVEPFRPYPTNYELGAYKWKFHKAAGHVASVTLGKTSLELSTGGSETLTATVSPNTATNQNLWWYSSNTSVATVDRAGKVTGVGEGTATITAVSEEGGITSNSCSVNVFVDYAAQIGSTKYETLAAAASAVSNNQTITLLRNVEEEFIYFGRTKKDVILDLNNKVVTGRFEMLNHTGEGGGTIHIQNGTIDGTILTTNYQDFDPGWAGDGVVELTGVTVNEVITAGHPYKINSGCVISNRLYVIGWSKTTYIYDGAKVKELNVSSAASGGNSAYVTIEGGFFGVDPTGKFHVTIPEGYYFTDDSGDASYPYKLTKGTPTPHRTYTIGEKLFDMHASRWYYPDWGGHEGHTKFNAHNFTSSGELSNYIEFIQDDVKYYSEDISRFEYFNNNGGIYGMSIVTATNEYGDNHVIPATWSNVSIFAWCGGDRGNATTQATIKANAGYYPFSYATWTWGWSEGMSFNLTEGAHYASIIFNQSGTSFRWWVLPVQTTKP